MTPKQIMEQTLLARPSKRNNNVLGINNHQHIEQNHASLSQETVLLPARTASLTPRIVTFRIAKMQPPAMPQEFGT